MPLTSGQLTLLAFVAAMIALIVLATRSVRGETATARQAAIGRGLEVTDVQRQLPVSKGRGPRQRFVLMEGECTRYALRLPRRGPTWALLMRSDSPAPAFAPGWELVEPREGLPPELRRVLEEIAAEWTEEYLELEGEPDYVVAYWEEQGGNAMVSRIHDYLSRCAAASV